MILYRKAVKMCTYDSILHHGPEHCFLYHLIRSLYLVNPFSAKDVLIDFTLCNARRFYSRQMETPCTEGVNICMTGVYSGIQWNVYVKPYDTPPPLAPNPSLPRSQD